MSAPWNEKSLMETGRAFMQPAVLLALVELDLFTELEEKPASAEEVARRLSLDPRAARIVLDAAAAMGLLARADGQYRTPPDLAPLVTSRRSDSLFWPLRHHARLNRNWSRIADAVREGGPIAEIPLSESAEIERESFIRAMHRVALPQAEAIARAIDPGPARRLLDVGGGPGTYTLALLKLAPNLEATIFDLPHAVAIARGYVRGAGLQTRVRFVSGDFEKDPLPPGNDLALVSAIIHQNSREENRRLFLKVHDALVRGGRIVVRDHVMDETRTRPPEGALFAVNMLLHTPGGGTYTLSEIDADLRAAGFEDVEYRQKSQARMDGIVDAWKK